jgi:hypothetical protein
VKEEKSSGQAFLVFVDATKAIPPKRSSPPGMGDRMVVHGLKWVEAHV